MTIKFDNLILRHNAFELKADFSIAKGSRVTLLGPSGGGKSTFLAAIAGFKNIEGGRILFGDQDISGLEPAKRPVTLLFQDHNLFPHLTTLQNIGLGLKPNLRLNAEEKATVQGALEKVGLDGLGDKRPGELSGGQQQRVAIARVILRQRPILLLDEPFAVLGPALKQEMLDLVAQVADSINATLLMVTHQPEDATYLGGDTVVVAEGRAATPVATDTLLQNPPAALRSYLGL